MKAKLISIAGAGLSCLLVFMAAGCAQNLSADDLARKVGQPSDVPFFGDKAVYMGDKDGYRYVHVRDLFDDWTWLGECTYMVPASDWPMANPMPLTCNASKWRDVEWLNGDGPPKVAQNAFLTIAPTFPVGAPATQPSTMSATTLPASEPK
jgi:hypothetical protein